MGRTPINKYYQAFETVSRWMIEDTKKGIFLGTANFMVALALFEYFEILGSFIVGNGSNGGKNFDAFFGRMGNNYSSLLKKHNKRRIHPHVIYDDLRCGFSHEYAPKRKFFTVFGANSDVSKLSDSDTKRLVYNQINRQATNGIEYDSSHKRWLIYNPYLWVDFKNTIFELREEFTLEPARTKFLSRCRDINIIKFASN